MFDTRYSVGDPVVYVVDKHTTHPGPRAKGVYPTPKGDFYQYSVDKFWRVAEVLNDGQLRLLTRRGKEHIVARDNPRLRKAKLRERIFYRHRFPAKA